MKDDNNNMITLLRCNAFLPFLRWKIELFKSRTATTWRRALVDCCSACLAWEGARGSLTFGESAANSEKHPFGKLQYTKMYPIMTRSTDLFKLHQVTDTTRKLQKWQELWAILLIWTVAFLAVFQSNPAFSHQSLPIVTEFVLLFRFQFSHNRSWLGIPQKNDEAPAFFTLRRRSSFSCCVMQVMDDRETPTTSWSVESTCLTKYQLKGLSQCLSEKRAVSRRRQGPKKLPNDLVVTAVSLRLPLQGSVHTCCCWGYYCGLYSFFWTLLQ